MDTLSTNSHPRRTIALTFSGGGFRAAGFSLGTMVLLQKLGLLSKVQAISSASGGSIAAAFFLMAKAKVYTTEKPDLLDGNSFYQEFYTRLKYFLESDKVANGILSDLGGSQKMIKNAANCYKEQLLETLFGISKPSPARGTKEINERVWQLLQDANTSPDCLSINSTNMTDASLFRFAMLRTIIISEDKEIRREGKGIVIGNKFIDISDPKNQQISQDCQNLSLGDMIAASSCFPLGFEPIIFPDDFGDNQESLKRLQKLTPNQDRVALMDAGLYDNLALTSVESLRLTSVEFLGFSLAQSKKIKLPNKIDLVIATDADNLEPSSALLEPSKLNQVKKFEDLDLVKNLTGFTRTVLQAIIKPLNFLFTSFKCRWIGWLASQVGIRGDELSAHNSWRSLDHNKLAKLIPDRLKELSPVFGSFLQRNRKLTYQFLQYKYEQESNNSKVESQKIDLVRNLIFDLYRRNDQDLALSELDCQVQEWKEEAPLESGETLKQIKNMIAKINTLVLALVLDENEELDTKDLIGRFEINETNNQEYLICLSKLATALPTTLWLKWYNVCSVDSSEISLIKKILDPKSVLIWKIDNQEQTKKLITNLKMTFASKKEDKRVTAAEVVIACGFVAACYNLLEYSASKTELLYSNQSDFTLTKVDRNNPEQMKTLAEIFKAKFSEKSQDLNLDIGEIKKAAAIWWEIISRESPSQNFSEEESLHLFIKHIVQMLEELPAAKVLAVMERRDAIATLLK
ncbi:patatin-like phospholipase family protein [Microcystis aeruginosa]|uniref:PNPLA domain-containing protein n=1 Tax=Microcystis aeruginosa PCC 9443 TaxID=1160281 RepID=I4G9X2_MICAE|nr:patatin-like phospholipase family protein [Microcystis aeruginosa]CCI04733.1 hypothetical protein MICAC_5930019 [Microcystis aeruginosa PCC 9443]